MGNCGSSPSTLRQVSHCSVLPFPMGGMGSGGQGIPLRVWREDTNQELSPTLDLVLWKSCCSGSESGDAVVVGGMSGDADGMMGV